MNVDNPKQKVFIKSNNSIKKISLNYVYSLLIFTVLSLIINYLLGNKEIVIATLKSLIISLAVTSFITYIINLFSKKYQPKYIYQDTSIIGIAIILGLFGANSDIVILILAITISLIIKALYQGTKLVASLYGILLLILYRYYTGILITPLSNLQSLNYFGTYEEIVKSNGSILDYLFSLNNLSPIIAVISFIYLFKHKSIKYNLVISYLLTFFSIMFLYGIFNNMNIWFVFFEITTGGIIFLSIYALSEYRITPTLSEGQIIYGIILGIITSILRFIIPNLSVVITMILGPIVFTKILEHITPKLKYRPKYYYITIAICIILVIVTIITLSNINFN